MPPASGLFRTEILFMVAPSMPRAEAQEALYRAILQSAGGKSVTFRTLDIGGDKILPYMRKVEEENPALGWRAVRIGLDRPALLKAQFRAILKACAGRVARIMMPMVATVDEFRQARAMLERERAYVAKHGHQGPRDVKLGVMLEVPSLLFDLDNVLKHADFVSVGSNDLMQFLFAVDRDNRRVSARFDTLNPALLRALGAIADKAAAAGKPLHGLRGDGGPADRGHGASGARLPLVVDVASRHRSCEGDAARTRYCCGRGGREGPACRLRRLPEPAWNADSLRRGERHSGLSGRQRPSVSRMRAAKAPKTLANR